MVPFSHSALLVAVIANGAWSFTPQIKVFLGIQSLVSHPTSRKPSLQFQRSLVRRNQGEDKTRSNIGVLTTPPAQQSEEYETTATPLAPKRESSNQTSPTAISLWMARAILLLVAIVWGTNFATVKYLETLCFHPPCNHPPSEFALARFGVAGLASLPFVIGQPSPVILAGLECGLWIAVGYFTQGTYLTSRTDDDTYTPYTHIYYTVSLFHLKFTTIFSIFFLPYPPYLYYSISTINYIFQ
jgi:hypothetical protein